MRPSPFSRLPATKPDPIFQIAAEARAAGPDAINGTVGMFLDEQGKTHMFPSVQQAVDDLQKQQGDFSYPPLNGLPKFREAVHRLLFASEQIASIATTGGTEAVAFNLRLLKKMDPHMKIILPEPTWANHRALCEDAGLHTESVPYLSDGKPTIERILEASKHELCAVLLHGHCHNPTGLDFTPAQWQELAVELEKNGNVALLDTAYQGFAGDPEHDAAPIQILSQAGTPTLVAWSASKNHSIYSERVGLAAAIVPDAKTQKIAEGQFATITRRIHSASASFGQRIVTLVQENYPDEWRHDLHEARVTLRKKREELSTQLSLEFSQSLAGNGLFALLPLSIEEIQQLKNEKIFLAYDGRINIAGIPQSRLAELAEKIKKLKGV